MIVKNGSSARLGHEAEQLYNPRVTLRNSIGEGMLLATWSHLKDEASKVCTHSQEVTSIGRALGHSLRSLDGGLP